MEPEDITAALERQLRRARLRTGDIACILLETTDFDSAVACIDERQYQRTGREPSGTREAFAMHGIPIYRDEWGGTKRGTVTIGSLVLTHP